MGKYTLYCTNKSKHWTSYWIRITPVGKYCTESFASKEMLVAEKENVKDVTGSSPCWTVIKSLQARHGDFEQLYRERRILNLDTTALVAVVSELVNGGTEHLLRMSAVEREKRFPRMAKFVHEQALVELDEPFLPQFEKMLFDKLPVICEYVYDEFLSIVLTNGGFRENQRARILVIKMGLIRQECHSYLTFVILDMRRQTNNTTTTTGRLDPKAVRQRNFELFASLIVQSGAKLAIHSSGSTP